VFRGPSWFDERDERIVARLASDRSEEVRFSARDVDHVEVRDGGDTVIVLRRGPAVLVTDELLEVAPEQLRQRIAYQGPPITAAIRLAINEVNEAGGVLGSPVVYVDGDDGGSADVAGATLDVLISKGVQAIVGPCCSGVSLKILPKVVQNNLVMISMSATSDALTKVDDKGLFFRTSPPDKLQAKALADIVMRDGAEKIFLVARDDAYGTGLQQGVQADLNKAGIRRSQIPTITYKVKDKYDQGDLNAMFKPLAKQVKQFKPDAVVIVGFEESGLVVRSLKAEGITFRTS